MLNHFSKIKICKNQVGGTFDFLQYWDLFPLTCTFILRLSKTPTNTRNMHEIKRRNVGCAQPSHKGRIKARQSFAHPDEQGLFSSTETQGICCFAEVICKDTYDVPLIFERTVHWRLLHCRGLMIKRFDYSKVQWGSSYCDANIAHLRGKIKMFVANEHKEIACLQIDQHFWSEGWQLSLYSWRNCIAMFEPKE